MLTFFQNLEFSKKVSPLILSKASSKTVIITLCLKLGVLILWDGVSFLKARFIKGSPSCFFSVLLIRILNLFVRNLNFNWLAIFNWIRFIKLRAFN